MSRERSGAEEWILAVRLRQLGDVLAALEPLRAMRAHDPRRRIAYVVDAPFGDVLTGLDFIDRVLTPPRRGAVAWLKFLSRVRALHAVAAVDFHGSARSAAITLASGARQRVGFDVRGRRVAYTAVEARGEFAPDGTRIPHTPIVWGARLAAHIGTAPVATLPPALPVPAAQRAAGHAALMAAGVGADALDARRVVGLNPGRAVPTKSWPADRFIALARGLVRDGFAVVVLWGPGEEDTARAIAHASGASVTAKVALGAMPGVLSWLSALVTIDSGLKHLAVCTRVPTLTLFGSTDPREWHMGSARDPFAWRGLSCSPCRRLECPFGSPCMDFPDGEIARRVAEMMEERP